MGAPVYTSADFLQAMQNLLPRGRAWPRDLASLMARVFSGLSPTYARVQARDNALLAEALPSTTTELLPEWESTLGLPDPCAGLAPTIDQRRAQVVARFSGAAMLNQGFFIAFAQALGYTITITTFWAFRCGDRCESPLFDDRWQSVWQVNAPLLAQGTRVLECEFQRLKPANTTIIFVYS